MGSNNQPATPTPTSPDPAPPQTAQSVAVSITPASASLQTGQTQVLTATVTSDPKNQGVTWSLSGSCTGTACGLLSANSSLSGVAILYTAPASLPSPETIQITAVSVTDAQKSTSASITVSPAPGIPMPLTVGVSPASATVNVQGAQNFAAVVQNDSQNAGVSWTLSGPGCMNQTCGTLSANSSASGMPVTYTAPASIPSPSGVTLTATSVSNSKISASAAITIAQVQSPVTVSVSPAKQTVVLKNSQSFTATVQNDPKNKGVSWTLSGSGCSGMSCGTLSKTTSASGASITYTAPAAVPNPATVTLTATSVTDTSVSASAAITIAPPITVTVAPSNQTVLTTKSQDFTATVHNDPNNAGVTWKLSGAGCSGSACGTLSATSTASGTPLKYTAPANVPNPPTVKLTATSLSNSAVSAAATITIAAPAPPVTVAVSPSNQAVQVSNAQTFSATVQNDPKNNGVSWKLSGSGCSGSSCGILSSNSSASGASITYTAPASVPTPATVTLTATSMTSSSASTSATITIYATSANTGVAISPLRGGLTISQTLNFTATVSNDPSHQGVTWSASAGTFSNVTSSSAVYQAPNAAGVYTVTATSAANVTKSATAVIGVTDLPGVLTYHYDQARAGVNAQEFALTTANVNTSTFAKLFSCSVDGPVYAQPLWVASLPIGGGTHNVIFAGTVNDTLYAFDADANPCVIYWSNHLLPSNEVAPTSTDIGSQDIQPTVGIVGTPAIDLGSHVLYVVTKSMTQGSSCRAPGSCHQRLHAINIADGSETANGPVDLTRSITVAGTGDGSSGGRLPFDPWHENQRPGLALINNTVYLSWGSHTDQSPWHGWIIGFNKSDLRASPLLFNASPNGKGGGIWMAGGAPAVDSNNNLYVITGNGDFDGKSDFGDSFVKVSPGLSLLDWMTPFDQANMDSSNGDFGAGGAAILADLPSAPVQHLIIGGGKFGSGNYGELYVLNRDAMGHLEGTGTPIVQKFPVGSYLFATGAFWNNMLYIAGAGHPMKAFALNPSTAQFDPNPRSSSTMNFPGRGATPAVSSNGASNGILWAIDSSQTGPPSNYGIGPAVLHALDATSLGRELWNSSQVSRDQAGNAVKFTVPTVANGKVYIGTTSEIDVYGLLPN